MKETTISQKKRAVVSKITWDSMLGAMAKAHKRFSLLTFAARDAVPKYGLA
jgi:hypothetical protein